MSTADLKSPAIPRWVWAMLAGVAVFVLGYAAAGLGETSVPANAGGGAFDSPVMTDSAPIDGSQATEPQTGRAQFSNLEIIGVLDLPDQALDTLDLIDSDGPYPFDRDGLTFQNREGILPNFPRGHYREFTVITPGESDRGARRIVAGDDGELYYTADHYESFREIIGY